MYSFSRFLGDHWILLGIIMATLSCPGPKTRTVGYTRSCKATLAEDTNHDGQVPVYAEKPPRTGREKYVHTSRKKTMSWQTKCRRYSKVFGSCFSLTFIRLHCRAPPLPRRAMEQGSMSSLLLYVKLFLKPSKPLKTFGSRIFLVYPSPNPETISLLPRYLTEQPDC